MERYDIASNTWMAMADMLVGRQFFGFATIVHDGTAEEQDLFDSLIVKTSSSEPPALIFDPIDCLQIVLRIQVCNLNNL
jgi:hypothetical protein